MANNFLEQLVAEWYEYQGYFLRRNVPVGRRAKGGWDCELDVVAFHPKRRHLVHLEPSMDAVSWDKREQKYSKKFRAGLQHIPSLFEGLDIPEDIEQIAIFAFAGTKRRSIGGGRVLLVKELMKEIFSALRKTHLASNAIPEHLPILRSLQFVASYREVVWAALTESS
jgi:hypothetical protein